MKQRIYIGEGGDLDGCIIIEDTYDNTFSTLISFYDLIGIKEKSRGYIFLPLCILKASNTKLTYIGDL